MANAVDVAGDEMEPVTNLLLCHRATSLFRSTTDFSHDVTKDEESFVELVDHGIVRKRADVVSGRKSKLVPSG